MTSKISSAAGAIRQASRSIPLGANSSWYGTKQYKFTHAANGLLSNHLQYDYYDYESRTFPGMEVAPEINYVLLASAKTMLDSGANVEATRKITELAGGLPSLASVVMHEGDCAFNHSGHFVFQVSKLCGAMNNVSDNLIEIVPGMTISPKTLLAGATNLCLKRMPTDVIIGEHNTAFNSVELSNAILLKYTNTPETLEQFITSLQQAMGDKFPLQLEAHGNTITLNEANPAFQTVKGIYQEIRPALSRWADGAIPKKKTINGVHTPDAEVEGVKDKLLKITAICKQSNMQNPLGDFAPALAEALGMVAAEGEEVAPSNAPVNLRRGTESRGQIEGRLQGYAIQALARQTEDSRAQANTQEPG